LCEEEGEDEGEEEGEEGVVLAHSIQHIAHNT
jgi:hypothetical protein